MPKRDNKAEGFTLIEVLITCVIVGVLVSVLTPLLWQGHREWEYTRGQVELQSNLRQALDYLTKELHQADVRQTNGIQTLVLNGKTYFQYISSVNGGVYRIFLDDSLLKQQYLGTGVNPLADPQETPLNSSEVEILRFNLSKRSGQADKVYQISIAGRFRNRGPSMTVQTQVTPRVQ